MEVAEAFWDGSLWSVGSLDTFTATRVCVAPNRFTCDTGWSVREQIEKQRAPVDSEQVAITIRVDDEFARRQHRVTMHRRAAV